MFNKIVIIFILLTFIRSIKSQMITNMESIVINQIFTNYSKNMRPTDQVEINLNLNLKQIVNVDDTNQLVTTSSYLTASWFDPRLKWNSSLYPLYAISFKVNQLWIPDLFVLNTANSNNGFLPLVDSNLGYIINNGQVVINYGLIGLTTRCKMNIYKFPMDEQNCSINIGSWFADTSRITIINQKLNAEINTGFIENQIWTLMNQSTNIIQNTTRFSNVYLSDEINFTFRIKRGPLYYVINNVYPCLILNIITLLTFFLPFAIQASLSI
jgi:nicotinic acetylcholine receptor